MEKSLFSKLINYIIAILASLFFLFPLYWTLITSFKSYKESFQQPPILFVWPDLTNYINFFQQTRIMDLLMNSVLITISSVIISMVVGTLAAYSLSRSRIKGKEQVGIFLIASRFIPAVSTLIPIYMIFRKIGLYDTRLGLVILNCAMNIPYVVWVMRGFIDNVPVEVEESAWVDGCSKVRGLVSIVLPMIRAGIGATTVLITIFSWNEYLFAMMLTSTKAKTLPLSMMAYMGEMGIDWHMMATAGIVIIFPTIVFSILAHRNLGSGLSMGAVKG